MKKMQISRKRTYAYLVTIVMLSLVLLKQSNGIVWAQEYIGVDQVTSSDAEGESMVPNIELVFSDNGISNMSVTVTYSAEKGMGEGQAYRRVEKLSADGTTLLHEGMIAWDDNEDSLVNLMSETYSVKEKSNIDDIYIVDEGEYRVTFCWQDADGNVIEDSEQSGTFIIDTTAPAATLTCKDEDGMAIDRVNCEFRLSDENFDGNGVTIVVETTRNDKVTTKHMKDMEFVNDIAQDIVFEEEGNYTVYAQVVDLAGNVLVTEKVSFVIDRSAPVISNITYSNSKGFLREKYGSIFSKDAILLEFVISDSIVGVNEQKVYVTVGDEEEKDDNAIQYLGHHSVGNHYYVYIPTDLKVKEFTGFLTIWAEDLLGNECSAQSTHMIYATTKPTIQMNCDVDYSKWTNRDVAFQTTVTDEVAGLKQIVYKINGEIVKKIVFHEPVWSYQYEMIAKDSASKIDGYAVTVEAINNCGVMKTASRQVYIDKEKPRVQLNGIQKNAHCRASQAFTTEVKDISYTDTKTVYYVTRIAGKTTTAISLGQFKSRQYVDSCIKKLSKEGMYEIYAVTTDGAGNKQKSNTLAFVIDKTAPNISITGVTDGSMSGHTVTLRMECEETYFATTDVNIVVEKELDGKKTKSEITDFPRNVKKATLTKDFSEDGTYTVTMTAKDRAGNVARRQTITFSVDVTNPQIHITGTAHYQMWKEPLLLLFVVEESYYSGNQVTITGSRTDVCGNKHWMELPQMISNGKRSSIQQLFEEDGFYECFITAEDKAGNKASKSICFTIDRTKPKIKGLEQYQGGYYQSFQLKGTVGDMFKDLTVTSYQMLLNGIEYNGIDVIEKEGKYNLYVEAKDELGNTAVENIEFIIDHTPPKVIFSGAKNGETVTQKGIISLALADSEDIITGIRMNGVEYDADIRELAYDKYGAYHIEVDCKDLAGNMVTRELYFVYNNYIMIIMIVVVATVLMVGTSIWFGLHRTKKKGKCRHDRSSSI